MIDNLSFGSRLRLRVALHELLARKTATAVTPPSPPRRRELEFKGLVPSVVEQNGRFYAEAGQYGRWGRSPEQARRNLAVAMRES
jgi:hypothetical protein